MTFIITLISIVIERFFHWGHLRHWGWYERYEQSLNSRIGTWPSYALLFVSILPLLLVVGLINYLLCGILYGVLKIIFGVIVLLYCLGPSNLWLQVYSSINSLRKDDPKAAIDNINATFGLTPVDNAQDFHKGFTRVIFVEAYQRLFSVLFWFVVLGPVGAVLYRAVSLSAKSSPLDVMHAAQKTQLVMDWVPVRVFTFIFALGGHFTKVFAVWKNSFKLGLNSNDKVLADCGVAALDVMQNGRLPEEGVAEKEALALLDRVFVMGLVILAVIVLLT